METGVHGNQLENVRRPAALGRFVENEVAIIHPPPQVENIVRGLPTIHGYVTERLAQVGTIQLQT